MYLNDDNELYLYDGKDSEKVIEDVMDIYSYDFVDGQEKVVLVYVDEDYTEYLVAIDSGEVVKIVDEKSIDIHIVDENQIIYLRQKIMMTMM